VTTLKGATNRAADKVTDGDWHAAILCYRDALNRLFVGAPPHDQERFLREYLDHCRRLELRKQKTIFKAEAIRVAERYLQWYEDTPSERYLDNIRIVVDYLGDDYVTLNQRQQLIRSYTSFGLKHAEGFNDAALDLWEGSLRTNPDTQVGITASEVQVLVQQRSDYLAAWDSYRMFLQRLAAIKDRDEIAKEYLRRAKRFMGM